MKRSNNQPTTLIAGEPFGPSELPVLRSGKSDLPALLDASGPAAQFAWEEFIFAKIRNPHTRVAYERSVKQFMRHCERLGRELQQISPRDVASYLDQLECATATKKLHLAGLRHFFDTLVMRHVVILNPAHSVRGVQATQLQTTVIKIRRSRLTTTSVDCEVLNLAFAIEPKS